MTSEQLTVLKQRISEETLRKARQRLERLNAIPEALVCVSCAEKPGR